MTEEYNSMANSIFMWIACVPGIFIVLYQALKFFLKSKKSAASVGLSIKQINSAIRSAAITSIGPCFVMLTTMLTLMLYVGAPLAWLRVDFIGSAIYELQAADLTSGALGVELGSAAMDSSFLATSALVMGLGCIPWVLFAAIFSDKMEKVNKVMAGGNAKAIPIIGTGGLIGIFCSLTADKVYPVKTQIVAVIVAALVMLVIQKYNDKHDKQWVKEWSLTICMLCGMVAATAAGYAGLFVA
jgi:hypothetical protein